MLFLSVSISLMYILNEYGIFSPKPIFEISDDEWLNYFNINVLSGIRLARSYTALRVDGGVIQSIL
ncbi:MULTISPECIES: hypothetical protein [Xenorhabdus]|uniref:hypothetical protein n=1 Tax=Xenorhabdus TaxID=626 RepID=UPI0006495A4E|nr:MULTISPECIES: hypothetical protein [Xenorhabdus]KLU14430.1 hypothetical protein AAY47_16375 [Xenorhabdus griffiniae]KOP33433.1 hypothetical protein AFK69_09860 [Xenorhabdus sp. GDc328]